MTENSGRIKFSLVGAVALWIFARTVFAATLPVAGPQSPSESKAAIVGATSTVSVR